MRFIKIAICALVLCLLFCSCSNKRLTPSGDKLVDGKTGIRYNVAPVCYEPVTLGKEFARSDRQDYEVVYFLLGELSSSEWLCDGEYNVYYTDGVKLPTFEQMMINRILVCREDQNLIAIKDITDEALVDLVIDGYKSAPQTEYVGLKADVIYEIKFRSAIYPYIQYSLSYYEYKNGCVLTDKTDDIENYKYFASEDVVDITIVQNEDGSYTITYDYGKYFIRNEADGSFVRLSDEVGAIIGSQDEN